MGVKKTDLMMIQIAVIKARAEDETKWLGRYEDAF